MTVDYAETIERIRRHVTYAGDLLDKGDTDTAQDVLMLAGSALARLIREVSA